MLIDALVICLIIFSTYRGFRVGFSRQLLPTLGFFGGLWLGVKLQPYVATLFSEQNVRVIAMLMTSLVVALICLTIGEVLGVRLKYRLVTKKIDKVDNLLGSVLSVFSLLIILWIGSMFVSHIASPRIRNELQSSALLRSITMHFPSASAFVAGLNTFVNPNGFPQAFIGGEPAPQGTLNLPPLGNLQHAVSKDRLSVVRIEGLGCGGIVEGSGFVAGKNLVITNAHVVAGISKPVVEDSLGNHGARVVSFDPKLDLAILNVNVSANSLAISSVTVPDNSPAAVLGYPGGGSFDAKSAVILRQILAGGRNIYGKGLTLRDIYEVAAHVIPGNSGGPIVNTNGDVVGVIFAQSTSYKSIGYALTTPKVISELSAVSESSKTVSSGNCAE